jgi:hypothetical protein
MQQTQDQLDRRVHLEEDLLGIQEPRDLKATRDLREPREHREHKVTKEMLVSEPREPRATRERKVTKEM